MRRFKQPRVSPRWWVLLVLVALALYRLASDPRPLPQGQPGADDVPLEQVRVERIVDGDTLLLDDRRRLRLMGVNCPESVKPDSPVEPWGLEAAEFTRRWIAAADERVRLEYDRERVDQYGRTLAFVWHDSQLLQEDLLRAGLARFEPQYSYAAAMKTRFRRAEQSARQERRGLWSTAEASNPRSR